MAGWAVARDLARERRVSYILPDDIEDYALRHTRVESDLLAELAARTRREMELARMLTGRLEGRLLKLLVQLAGPQLAIEVGTFTGYGALSIAEGLDGDGRLITCEVDPAAAAIAREAFAASPVGARIELRMGPAIDTIHSLDEPVGFSFIDADKAGYPDYYEALLDLTVPGGLLVLDNMLWSGRVLDPPDDETRVLAALNTRIAADDRVENVLLTVRDGIQVVRKR
jgi:caffeoyl-CoA O-methyltransferase